MRHLLLTTAAVALTWCVPAAHHSYALYDRTTTISIEGTVDEIEWVAPHVRIVVRDEGGTRYVAEWRAPTALARMGAGRESLHEGDRVVVAGNPKRDFDESHIVNVTTVRRMSDGRQWPAS